MSLHSVSEQTPTLFEQGLIGRQPRLPDVAQLTGSGVEMTSTGAKTRDRSKRPPPAAALDGQARQVGKEVVYPNVLEIEAKPQERQTQASLSSYPVCCCRSSRDLSPGKLTTKTYVHTEGSCGIQRYTF